MTTQASTPSAPAPSAALPTPLSAPASSPAAGQPAKSQRAALADRLVAAPEASDGDSPLESPAAPTFTPDPKPTPPQEPTPTGPSKLETVRATLAKQKADRESKRAAEAQTQHLEGLQKQLEALKSQPSVDQFLAEYERDPAATLRKYKVDPRKHLDLLTEDALTPGAPRNAAAARDEESAGARALAEIEKMRAQQAAEQQTAAGNRHNAEYLEATAPSKDPASPAKYPYLSKLPEARRLRLALAAWTDLSAQGAAYDRDLVAEYVEAQLEEDHKAWAPPQPPPADPAPSSQTSATPAPTASAKQKPRTITPDIAGATGGGSTNRKASKAERRAALASRLKPVEG